MPESQTFRRRPAEVQALQWTGDNAAELEKFAGPDFDVVDQPDDNPEATAAIREGVHGTWELLYTGDWVIRDAEGRLAPVRAADFDAAYERQQASRDPAALMRLLATEIRSAAPHDPGELELADLFEAGARAVETPDPALDQAVVTALTAFAVPFAAELDLPEANNA